MRCSIYEASSGSNESMCASKGTWVFGVAFTSWDIHTVSYNQGRGVLVADITSMSADKKGAIVGGDLWRNCD